MIDTGNKTLRAAQDKLIGVADSIIGLEYASRRFTVNNGMDVTADCRILATEGKRANYSTQNGTESKARWNEYRVWECHDGSWIAEKTRKSTGAGEVDMTDLLVISVDDQPIHSAHGRTQMAEFASGSDQNWQFCVLDFFEWHNEAKAFAKAAGWDVRLRITRD